MWASKNWCVPDCRVSGCEYCTLTTVQTGLKVYLYVPKSFGKGGGSKPLDDHSKKILDRGSNLDRRVRGGKPVIFVFIRVHVTYSFIGRTQALASERSQSASERLQERRLQSQSRKEPCRVSPPVQCFDPEKGYAV